MGWWDGKLVRYKYFVFLLSHNLPSHLIIIYHHLNLRSRIGLRAASHDKFFKSDPENLIMRWDGKLWNEIRSWSWHEKKFSPSHHLIISHHLINHHLIISLSYPSVLFAISQISSFETIDSWLDDKRWESNWHLIKWDGKSWDGRSWDDRWW